MKIKQWEVRIRLPGGLVQKQIIQADNSLAVQKIVEAQYKGCKIVGAPIELRK